MYHSYSLITPNFSHIHPHLSTHIILIFFIYFLTSSQCLCCSIVMSVRPALKCDHPTKGQIIKEIWVFSQQLWNANSSSARRKNPRPPPCWDFVWLKLAGVLCMLSQSLCAHMCKCPTVCRRHCFLVVIHYPWLLQPGHHMLSFTGNPVPLWEWFNIDLSFKDKHFAVSYSLHVDQLWVSVNCQLLQDY